MKPVKMTKAPAMKTLKAAAKAAKPVAPIKAAKGKAPAKAYKGK